MIEKNQEHKRTLLLAQCQFPKIRVEGDRREGTERLERTRARLLAHGISAAIISLVILAIAQRGIAQPLNAQQSAQQGLQYLANVMDQYHSRFIVYEDVSSAGNHFHAWGKIPNGEVDARISGASTVNPHSGATAIRCEFHQTPAGAFGGYYFLNGVLRTGALAPDLNFGTDPTAGIDLSGATALTFWARAEGTVHAEFFVAGVGRDSGTGEPLTPCSASVPGPCPYPDSAPVVKISVTLDDTWKQYSIDLRGKDLSYLLGGFGWVTTQDGAIFYLDDIWYDLDSAAQARRLSQPRLLRSFTTLPVQPNPFDANKDDDLDFVLRNTAFTYDNALALISFLTDGSADALRRARLIGDAFVYASSHDRTFDDGRVRTAYAAGDIFLPPGWTPNDRVGTVPIPGFYVESVSCPWLPPGTPPGCFFEVEQYSVDVGNNAWAMIALLALHLRTGVPEYLDTARRIGEFIQRFRNDAGLYQGFQGGIDSTECPPEGTPTCPPPSRRLWASTEHNLDVHAAFNAMFATTGEPQWQDGAEHARQFVEAMWDAQRGCFLAGTNNPDARNAAVGQLPLDTQSWNVLARPDALTLHPDLLRCAEINHGTTHDGFTGFDFNEDRDGVWFEGTAQMAVAYAFARQDTSAEALRAELRRAQQTSPFGNSGGIAAASHDGVSTGFTISPTGDPFKLFRRLHVGATSWNVFAQFGFNPYYQTTPLATVTPTITATAPGTPTFTFIPSPTPTATSTPSSTVTSTGTSTAIPSSTSSATSTRAPTLTLPPTHSPTLTPPPTWTPSLTATWTLTLMSTATPTPTRTFANSPTPTQTRASTATAMMSNTPTQAITSTTTHAPISTPTEILTATPRGTPSGTTRATPTTTPTSSMTATTSFTYTPTGTDTRTATPTALATARPTATPTMPPTNTSIPTATFISTPTLTVTPTVTLPKCVGDCDGGGDVTVDELITMVNIAIGNTQLSACPAGDSDGIAGITINEIIAAVHNALDGCRSSLRGRLLAPGSTQASRGKAGRASSSLVAAMVRRSLRG